MADNSLGNKMPHNIIMEARHSLTVSGVEDIDSFDEQTVVIYTQMGELTVKGEDLHINRLSLEAGELLIEGEIYALVYSENKEAKAPSQGFFAKVFR